MSNDKLFEDFNHGIAAIDTAYVRPRLDASHLIARNGELAFVDCGTTFSVPNLLATLDSKSLNVADVQYLFLTHIHLDHAGGAGALMQALPNATAVLHPRGARHMVSPAKLIEGSIAVYGKARFDALYGEIVPIDEHRVRTVADNEEIAFGGAKFRVLHTEGHARHHYCLQDPVANSIFTGDSFGIAYREFYSARGPFIFPTTTPVHFDPAAAHATIDRLAALAPRYLFLTHYSRVTLTDRLVNDMHACLHAFEEIATRLQAAPQRQASIAQALLDYLSGRLDEHGLDGRDPALRDILRLDADLNAMGLDVWLTEQRKRA